MNYRLTELKVLLFLLLLSAVSCQRPMYDEEDDEGAVDDSRDDECSRAQMHQAKDARNDGDRHIEGDVRLLEGIAIGIKQIRPGREGEGDQN